MPRIQGLTEVFLSGDLLLKTGKGEVFSITIGHQNAAAGQRVVLRDGTDNLAPPLAIFCLATASGTIIKDWANGKRFETGLYVDFEGAASPAIQAELTYK